MRISNRMKWLKTLNSCSVWLFWVTAVQRRDKNRFFLLSTTLQLQSPNNYRWWAGSSWPYRLTEKLTNCPVDLSTRHKLAVTTMPDAGVCKKTCRGRLSIVNTLMKAKIYKVNQSKALQCHLKSNTAWLVSLHEFLWKLRKSNPHYKISSSTKKFRFKKYCR